MASRSATKDAKCFTNTAKLPIEIVKRLIAAVAARPSLWIRNLNGQKRGDINLLWHQVGQEVHLPADICRIKWGHLRDNFRKVFIRNTFSDEAPTTWRFYNDMKFMEKAVAVNIKHQKGIKDQYRPWSELQNDGFYNQVTKMVPQYGMPICEPQTSYQRNMHTNNSTDTFTYSDDDPQKKRIKTESEEQHNEDLGSSSSKELKLASLNNSHSKEYVCHDTMKNYTEEDDDDDFDEDAVTEENDQNCRNTNNNIFAVEMFDDNVDNNIKNNFLRISHHAQFVNKMECQNSNELENMGTSSKLSAENLSTSPDMKKVLQLENNSDRMFLLSLLPFLEKVDENRKLHVRQKIQSVLIEEFG